MISLPLLSPPLERKNCTVTACDLADCLVASPAVMCTPLDVWHRKKNVTAPRKPVHRVKRSASLTSLTQPLCPLENGKLSPKAMELLGSLTPNSIDLKSLSLQGRAGAGAAPGCQTCMHYPELISFEPTLESAAYSTDSELTSLKRQEIISALETSRPRSTGKDSDQLASDGEVKTPPLSRKERVEAFEYERVQRSQKSKGRSSHKHDKQLINLLKIEAAQARPSSADQHVTAAKRRAEYEVKRREEMLKRKERAQRAKEFIRQCLEEWQVPADVGQAVVGKSLLKARLDGYGGIEKEVTLDMVLGSCEEAKGDYFRSKIEPILARKCPNGILRDVIQKSSAPWNWVSFLSSNLADDTLRNYSSSLAEFIKFATQSTRFVCPICADSMFSISDDASGVECNLWSAASRKNEHWNNHACGHTFCRSCARQWAETAINDQQLQIRCPAIGCKYTLWDQDLKELLSSKMFLRHQEHLHTDHLKHLKDLAKEDDDLTAWLRQNARPCPDCHVIVSRSEGCNSMICVCGTHFCYACGFKTCQCGVKGRGDIWEPKA